MSKDSEAPEPHVKPVGPSPKEAVDFYSIQAGQNVTRPSGAQYITLFPVAAETIRRFQAALGYVTRFTLNQPSGVHEYATTFVRTVYEKVGPLYPAIWSMYLGTRQSHQFYRYVTGDVVSAAYTDLGNDVFDLTFSSIERLEDISARQASIHSYIGLLWDFGRQFADLVSRYERRRTPWNDEAAAPDKSKPSVFTTEESDERFPWTRQARPPRSHLYALASAA